MSQKPTVKTEVVLWKYGKSEPDSSPMVVSHPEGELPKVLRLASFDAPDLCYFKLIDLIFGGRRVYYETMPPVGNV